MYRISIFQLYEEHYDSNGDGTKDAYRVSKVAGTERIYGSFAQDFLPVELGDLQESLEIEEGRYKLDNLSMVVEGLAADVFKHYNDLYNEPFVLLIENEITNEVIWHGVIDPDSIRYNARTKRTSLEAFSWDYVLTRRDHPARSVFESDLEVAYSTGQDNPYELYLPITTTTGESVTGSVNPGDVVVFTTPAGEHRTPIVSVRSEPGRTVIDMIDMPDSLIVSGEVDWGRKGISYRTGFLGLNRKHTYQVVFKNPRLWSLVRENMDLRFNVVLNGQNGQTYVIRDASGSASAANPDTPAIRPHHDRETLTVYFSSGKDLEHLMPWQGQNPTSYVVYQEQELDAGSKIKILGRDIYGYIPAGDITSRYRLSEVVNAAHVGIDHGILSRIFTGVTGVAASDDFYLDRGIELPDSVQEALKLVLNTGGYFLRYHTSLDARGIPSVSAELIRRQSVDQVKRSPVAVSGVAEWTESAADRTPTAIIVKPNVEYRKPGGYGEVLGFYYEGVDDLDLEDRKLRGKPQGEGVVEITVAIEPEYNGEMFYGDGVPFHNDSRLKAVAEVFYNFYKGLKRPAEATIAERRSDLLGRYASFAEMDIDAEHGRSVFVTSQQVSFSGRRTTLSGRIGEFVPVTATVPKAVITGRTLVVDLDGNGFAEVNLSGAQSYDPQGGTLTYEWTDANGSVISTAPILRLAGASELPLGRHEITLTVRNARGGVSSTSVTVAIVDADRTYGSPTSFDAFNVVQERVHESGVWYGVIRLYPQVSTDEIASVEYRSAQGRDLNDGDLYQEATWHADGYYEVKIPLHVKHISTVEVRATFTEQAGIQQQTALYTFAAIPKAEFVSQSIGINANGNIIINIKGDIDTRTTDGIRVYASDDILAVESEGSLVAILDNPATGVTLPITITGDEGKYVRIVLVGTDGVDGEEWITYVTRMATGGGNRFVEIEIDTGGIFRGSGNASAPAMHLLAPDGSNYGHLILNSIQFMGQGTVIEGDIVTVEHNFITLNNNYTGSAPPNSGIEIERGSLPNVQMLFDEGQQRFGQKFLDGVFNPFLLADRAATISQEWTFTSTVHLFPPISNGTVSLNFNHEYSIYVDNVGAGFHNTRFWLHTPDGGEVVIGPRAGASWLDQIRLRARTYDIEVNGGVFGIDGNIGSQVFASGFAGHGWQIDSTNTATFQNLVVRGWTRLYELEIQKIRSGNGSYLFTDGMKISKAVRDSTSTVIPPGYGVYTGQDRYMYSLYFEEAPPFVKYDILKAQQFTGDGAHDLIFYVYSVSSTKNADGYYTVRGWHIAGSVPSGGKELVRVGNTHDTARQSSVYITSLDGGYIDVKAGVDNHMLFNLSSTLRVRLGNLSGIVDATFGSLSGYGLYSDNVYLKGTIYASAGEIAGWEINSTMIRAFLNGDYTFELRRNLGGRPVMIIGWGNNPSGGTEYITIGGATYLRTGIADTIVSGWDYSGGGISVNAGSRTLFFAGKRADFTGGWIAGCLFDFEAVWTGTKNNAYWQLRSDGTGRLASGLIEWTTSSITLAGWKVNDTMLYSDGAGAGNVTGIRALSGPKNLAIYAGSNDRFGNGAKFYVCNDGSGRLANGGIIWDATGNVRINGTLTAGVITGTVSVSGGSIVAGGGNVTLNNNGITLANNDGATARIKWSSGSFISSVSDGTVHIAAYSGGTGKPIVLSGISLQTPSRITIIRDNVSFRGGVIDVQTAPSATSDEATPPADTVRVYVYRDGSNRMWLCARFPNGHIHRFASNH